MKARLIALAISMLLVQQALAWSATGHDLICTIANQNLDKTTTEQISQLLTEQISYPGSSTISNETDSFSTACQWMDMAASASGWHSTTNQKDFKALHYINAEVTLGEAATKTDATNAVNAAMKASSYNVVNAINSAIKTLMTEKSTLDQAYALRVLLHTTGDIHQPLHASDPIILGHDTYGGNDIYLESYPKMQYVSAEGKSSDNAYPVEELHAFWDKVANDLTLNNQWSNFSPELKSPVPSFAKSALAASATNLQADYAKQPQTKTLVADPNPKDWAIDTNIDAIQQINDLTYKNDTKYNDVETDLTPSYIAQAQQVVSEQLVVAGLRLAKVLNAIYDPQNADPAYVTYVNKVANNSDIPTIEKLVPISISG